MNEYFDKDLGRYIKKDDLLNISEERAKSLTQKEFVVEAKEKLNKEHKYTE